MLIIFRVLATFGGKLESASKSEIIPWASPRVVQSTEPCNQNRKKVLVPYNMCSNNNNNV